MTAPGNATLLLTILAVFLGCTGYAAGRLHQWYRTGLDRDEAYRDGYDTGTRSTFSMAARIIGPRRDKTGIRASASVHAAGLRSGTPPSGAAGQRPSATAQPPSATAQRSSAADAQEPAAAAAAARGPSAAAAPAASSSPPAADAAPRAGEATPHGPGFPAPVSTAFPAPPPFEFPGRPAPARLGSDVWSTGRGSSSPAPSGSSSSASSSTSAAAGSDEPDPPVAPKRHRRGRHFVPDELIRAVTYRLAPDRVARAKVHEAKRASESAPEDAPPHPASEGGQAARVAADGDPAPSRASEGNPASRRASEGGPASRMAADGGAASRSAPGGGPASRLAPESGPASRPGPDDGRSVKAAAEDESVPDRSLPKPRSS